MTNSNTDLFSMDVTDELQRFMAMTTKRSSLSSSSSSPRCGSMSSPASSSEEDLPYAKLTSAIKSSNTSLRSSIASIMTPNVSTRPSIAYGSTMDGVDTMQDGVEFGRKSTVRESFMDQIISEQENAMSQIRIARARPSERNSQLPPLPTQGIHSGTDFEISEGMIEEQKSIMAEIRRQQTRRLDSLSLRDIVDAGSKNEPGEGEEDNEITRNCDGEMRHSEPMRCLPERPVPVPRSASGQSPASAKKIARSSMLHQDLSVELYPGRRIKLLDKEKTKNALSQGAAILVQCAGCPKRLYVSKDAKLLFCPACGTFTPTSLRVDTKNGGEFSAKQDVKSAPPLFKKG